MEGFNLLFMKARNNKKEPYGPVDLVYLLA